MRNWFLCYWSCERMQYVPCFSGTWVACFNQKNFIKSIYSKRSYIIVPRW